MHVDVMVCVCQTYIKKLLTYLLSSSTKMHSLISNHFGRPGREIDGYFVRSVCPQRRTITFKLKTVHIDI